jgi:hypothetical protein
MSGRDRAYAPEAWHLDALCAQIAPEEWFLTRQDRANGDGGLTDDEITKVCQRCPAMRYCLDRSLDAPGPRGVEEWGIWAGTNTWHRREFASALAAGVTTIDELADRLRREPAYRTVRHMRRRLAAVTTEDTAAA